MANEKSDKGIDDGGPAYPSNVDMSAGMLGASTQSKGMSVRMWLAGQAMCGMVSAPRVNLDTGKRSTTEQYAADALEYADALIEESRK